MFYWRKNNDFLSLENDRAAKTNNLKDTVKLTKKYIHLAK